MRTEQELNGLITEAKSAYHEIVDTGNRHELAAAAKAVTDLQAELQATLAAGADPCPECAAQPIGLLKRPAIYKGGLLEVGPVYEVGCLVCDVRRARGSTPAQAVESWNAGEHNTTRVHQVIEVAL